MNNSTPDYDHQKLVKEIADLVRPVDYHSRGYVSTREVADEAGITVNRAFKMLEALVIKGRALKEVDRANKAWWKLL